ncbi:MAG: sensor histidine kinase [Faecousia sp.]
MTDSHKEVPTKAASRFNKVSIMIYAAAGVALIVLLLSLSIMENLLVQDSQGNKSFTVVNDYVCRELDRDDTPIGVIKEYTIPISPTLNHDTHLAFYTVHQYVDVYIDAELVYSLHPSEARKITKTVGSNWTLIPLCSSNAGKEVRIEITPVYERFRDREVEFLIGSPLGIYVNLLYKDLPEIALSFITILVGIVFLFLAGSNLLRKRNGTNLAAISLYSIMLGLWRLTDSRFVALLFPGKPVLLFYISLGMMMLGFVPFIMALEDHFNKNSRWVLRLCCTATALISLVQLLLQIFGILDLHENVFAISTIIAVDAIILIVSSVYDQLKYKRNREINFGRKLALLLVAGILADAVTYYVKGNSSGLLFSLLAMLIYILHSGIAILFGYVEREMQLAEKDRLLAESKQQLTESRIATMISQIQPHFIYNTLGTIEQLCREEPEKASEVVHSFSLYLRGNFTELDNPAPIRLSKEMEHVRHYTDIEKVRFPDMTIQFDLRSSDFLLPALSVQPLVENAIKHGLMGLESGGTVTVSTYETSTDYCVSVVDDGVGFDPAVLQNTDKHIGIRNIRGRLEATCGGTLTVDSTPGKGTTALIQIPKEEETT